MIGKIIISIVIAHLMLWMMSIGYKVIFGREIGEDLYKDLFGDLEERNNDSSNKV